MLRVVWLNDDLAQTEGEGQGSEEDKRPGPKCNDHVQSETLMSHEGAWKPGVLARWLMPIL